MMLIDNPEEIQSILEIRIQSVIATTFTSKVYLCEKEGKTLVLKCLNKTGIQDEYHSLKALQVFGGDRAVELIKSHENLQLLEYLPGPDLAKLAYENDEGATQILADCLSTLHRKDSDGAGLLSLEDRFRSLLRSKNHPDKLIQKGAQIASYLLFTQESRLCLHGDLHHENVLMDQSGVYKVIDPKGLYGDGHYDCANLFLNPDGLEGRLNEKRIDSIISVLHRRLGYSRKRLLEFAFAHACLSYLWCLEDKMDGEFSLEMAKFLSKLL